MTAKQTFAAALCAAGLLAAPALAQDEMADKAKSEMTEMANDKMKDKAKSEMTDMAKDKATKVMTSEDGMMLKGDSLSMDDKKAMQKKMLEKKMMEEAGMSDKASSAKTYGEDWSKADTEAETMIELPAEPMVEPAVNTTTMVACPEGTTAQPDGTCMVTGDFDMEE